MSDGREDRYTDEDCLYFDKHFKVFLKAEMLINEWIL